MKDKLRVTAEHSIPVQLLEMINAVLGLTGLFTLAGCFSAPGRAALFLFTAFGLALLLPVAVSFVMVRKIRSLALYLLIAVLITAALTTAGFALGEVIPYGRLICAPLLLLLSVVIFVVRIRSAIEQRQMQNDFAATHDGEENVFMEKWEVASFLTKVRFTDWIITSICYLIACFLNKSLAILPLFILLFLQILVYFAHSYLENFEQYIRDNSRVANMPVSMMKRVHNTIFGIAAVLLLAFMLPAVIYGKEPMDGFLQRLPKREITVQQDAMLQENTEEQSMGGMDMNMDDMLGEAKELPEWVKKLMDLVAYALFAAVAILGVWALTNKLREFGREYSTEERDEVLFLDDVAEDARKMLYGGGRRDSGWFSPNAQIRRRYRKLIRKGTNGEPQSWATPTELEEAAKLAPQTTLHLIYEKARYSKDGCSKEDLEQLKG